MSHQDSPLISQPYSPPIASQSFEASYLDQPLRPYTLRNFPEQNCKTASSLIESNLKSQSRKRHSLRQIANGIRFLLNIHGELPICDLSNFIYQLVCQTKLGSVIAKGQRLNARELQRLRRRQTDLNYSHSQTLVRNVRRRLYDVLNVMISASIVKRYGRKVRLADQPFVNITGSLQPNDRERFNLLKVQAEVKWEKLKQKKQFLEQTAKDYLMIKKLNQRNENIQAQDFQRIKFPLLALTCDSKHTLDFSKEMVNIKTDKAFRVETEMNLMERIWPVPLKEIEKFFKN